MINRKLNFYFFGEIGEYDKYNPEFVCNREYASEILYIIAKINHSLFPDLRLQNF